jgi:hypothetical protein
LGNDCTIDWSIRYKIEDLEQIVKEDNKQRFSLTVLRQKLEQVKVIPMLMYNIETKTTKYFVSWNSH